MRSALICVFLALLVRRGSRADNDFRPTPIPLSEWRFDRRDARAGTLHDAISTDPPTVAAVPAHHWEDALRHSVYLTLVRDKIDQLIAKGEVISPNSKPEEHRASKDIDDHDLWEKIKAAPFERLKEEEPASFGDVTVMAKGRLVEDRGGFRFIEDDTSKEKCGDDKCMEGVKAFWSVKRVRQRDVEASPGKYNYELTFSVSSQHPKKQKKPYENPVRTFTVKETTPDQVLDMPQEHRTNERLRVLPPGYLARPTRAVWLHKNIVPTQGRQYTHGLDRIFSSFFSDDDDDYEPPRYRPHIQQPPIYPQYSKVGYVGSPSDHQKRVSPYPYRTHVHNYKYTRPLGPPPYPHQQHQFGFGSVETDAAGHSLADLRFGPPQKPIRTTRPAVLPTPLTPASSNNWTESDNVKQTTQTVKQNTTTEAPKSHDHITAHKTTHKIRPGPMKINYLPDHVRPPIYNAPPGVFVTMDKKPFKPMPPLKYITKPHKYKPLDFRPSPQVLDMQQFSEPDPQHDTAFRPITWNYSDNNTTEKTENSEEVAESSTQINNTRKTTPKGKKPPKKHENIKPSRVTTTAPEIITASSDSAEESDAMQWANVVGAFSKTTPMASEKKPEVIESTTPTTTTTSTTTASTTTAAVKRRTTTTTEAPVETTTTRKPKQKRTRPPPKFAKPDKLKKHKRVNPTTQKPSEVKPTQDLTPQASSSAASKAPKQPSTTSTTSATTTTKATTTTTRPTTTTTKPTTKLTTTTTSTQPPRTETKDSVSTTQPKNKNRFRQSTLMTKGTSVNHDKWSAPEKFKPTGPGATTKQPTRRKGSNFQGYVSSTTPRNEQNYEKIHEDKGSSQTLAVKPLSTTTAYYEETADQYESNSESSDYSNSNYDNMDDSPSGSEQQESRDHTEYIFQTSTTPSERTNEVDSEPITTEQINTSPISTPKNKTKCKKKKTQNSTSEGEESITEQTTMASSTTVSEAVTPSIFEELFGSFTVDDTVNDYKSSPSTSKPDLQEQGSEKHGQFVKLDDDLQDFLDSLERDSRDADVEDEYEEDEELEPSIDDEDNDSDVDDSATAREIMSHKYEDETVEDYKHPYSLLELMAME